MTYLASTATKLVLEKVTDQASLESALKKAALEMIKLIESEDTESIECLAEEILDQHEEDEAISVDSCIDLLSKYITSIEFQSEGAHIHLCSNSWDETSDPAGVYFLTQNWMQHYEIESCIIHENFYDSFDGLSSNWLKGVVAEGDLDLQSFKA